MHQDFLLLVEGGEDTSGGEAQAEERDPLGVGDEWSGVGRRAGHDLGHHRLRGRNQRELAARGALQQHAGDQQAVDFVGAFEDAVDARIAVGALDRVVLMVAVAAVDLDAFVDDVVEHFGGVDLDDGALDGELLDGLEHAAARHRARSRRSRADWLDQADDAPAHRFGGVDANRHFGELVLDRAELRDGRAEGLPLLGVLEATWRARSWRRPPCAGAQLQAADVEDVEGDDVPAADLAEHVLDRHRHVVEDRGPWWNCP